MKTEIEELVQRLQRLERASRQRADAIYDHGEYVPTESRKLSEGYSEAYNFCIMELNRILQKG